MENSIQVNLDSAKYDELLRVLFILKDVCNDVDIREGLVRQRSNDTATVFEIDLTSLISTISLPITELKTKLDIFKSFCGQEVSIVADGENFTIFDEYSMLKIKNPILEYLDNSFITREELERVVVTNQEDLILSTNISKKLTDRIKVISSSFHVNTIQTYFQEELATISVSNQSKNNFAKFISDIPLNRQLNHYINLVITPFIIDHDGDITMEVFDSGNNSVINSFSTTIGSITTNLYTRSSMVEIENS